MNVGVWAAGPLSAVVLLGLLAGCKTWQPATVSPERLIAEERPSSVRVTGSGGIRMTLRNPRLVNDSIVSSESAPPGATLAPPRVGVAREDVRSLEVARFSPGRTIALAAAITGASIAWASFATASRGSEPPPEPLPKDSFLALLDGIRLVLGVGR